MNIIKPPRLKKGDTNGLVSPSSNSPTRNIQKSIHRFKEMGYKVWVEDMVKKSTQWGYLAGTDLERAESVNNAFRNPEVDAIFCTVL